MELFEIAVYSLIGLSAGFTGGLLGIGGGLITVPALVFFFNYFGYPPDYGIHIAIGTSLAAMILTSASSALAHAQKKGVCWNIFPYLAIGMCAGALLGAIVAHNLSNKVLEVMFGLSLTFIGLYFIHGEIEEVDATTKLPSKGVQVLTTTAIGTIASILGIGGGILIVPFLTFHGVQIRNAVSTAAATGFVIALTGSISYFLLGLQKHHDTGYVYLPAFFAIGISSSIIAPFGAKLAYYMPTQGLKSIFGVFLIVLGMGMILSAK